MTVTSWPALSNSATSSRPMNIVPPITRTLIRYDKRLKRRLIVILLSQVRDQVLSLHPTQCVLELHELDEDIVLGIQARRRHRTLEVEGKPLLHPPHAGALRQVEEQHQVQHQRRRQNRIAAEEVDLDLHRVAEPAEDIDVVPPFLGVPAR